jgi:hypothetical protein
VCTSETAPASPSECRVRASRCRHFGSNCGAQAHASDGSEAVPPRLAAGVSQASQHRYSSESPCQCRRASLSAWKHHRRHCGTELSEKRLLLSGSNPSHLVRPPGRLAVCVFTLAKVIVEQEHPAGSRAGQRPQALSFSTGTCGSNLRILRPALVRRYASHYLTHGATCVCDNRSPLWRPE